MNVWQTTSEDVRRRVRRGCEYYRLRPRSDFPGLTDQGYRALTAYALACDANRQLRRHKRGRGLRHLIDLIRSQI